MSQRPAAGKSDEEKFMKQNAGHNMVFDQDNSICHSVPSSGSTMTSDEAGAGAAQPIGRAGGSGVGFTVEDGSISNERYEQSPSLSLDAPSPVLKSRPSNPSFGLRSPPSATSGSPTLSSNSRAGTRNRGYSLRTSLFRRNIRRQPEPDGAVVEMVPQETSLGHSVLSTISGKNEMGQPSITVATVGVDKDCSLHSDPTRSDDTLTQRHFVNLRSLMLQPCWHLLSNLRRSYENVRKALLRKNQTPTLSDGRHIVLDFSDPFEPIDTRTGGPYINNVIRSSRYTLANFFPRQLLAQFSKLANFYFLSISILQMIPGLSTTGTYTTIVPLLIFVGISMAKEGYDDIRRWRLDQEENHRSTLVLDREWHIGNEDKTRWMPTSWRDVKVGDMLLLHRNDPIPADVALLHTDDSSGAANIETMALDGETNLKMKRPILKLSEACHSPEAVAQCRAHFTVEDPNIDLYNFDGKVAIGTETFPLTNNQIIYRGSVLRNTQTVTGLVIFTGEECKIRMNANKNPRIKAPALQAVVNRVVIIVVLIVLALAIFNSVAYEVWQKTTESKSWYLHYAQVAFGPIFTSYIIMFNTMIPLSLYVSLEIVKLCQMFLMSDVDMYDEDSNTPMEARTTTINEELGQVSYIFSDKTGTLTENSMRFRRMSVAGTAWLHERDLSYHSTVKVKPLHEQRNNKGKGPVPRKTYLPLSVVNPNPSTKTANISGDALGGSRGSSMSTTGKPPIGPANAFGGRSEEMLEYILRRPHTMFAQRARLFILSIALCHTCVPEKHEDGNVTFQAASPDELALVNAAKELGYVVVNRQPNSITIQVSTTGTGEGSSYETFEVLDVIEFSSVRKRQSVIVRMPDRRICIFCKGADSTVTGLLRLSTLASETVADIEHHNNQRKSIEAQEALRRRSQHVLPGASNGRKRSSFSRLGAGIRADASTSVGGNCSIRDSMDHWLKDRETDVHVTNLRDSAQYYSPRPSQQPLSTDGSVKRFSVMIGEERHSSQIDDLKDLVDEALVVNEKLVFERCFRHINDFATEGLRTLMYGYREISEEEYVTWKSIYLNATTSLVDRQKMIEEAADRIESQLELVGATAIEDKLQKGVPDTIDRLRRAGIKLWMLTGDKRETAINIGHSCHLIKNYSTLLILDHEKGEVDQRMAKALVNVRSGQVAHSVVVVDGQTLASIEVEASMHKLFIELAICVDSVICCRASPSQKASLVKAIRLKLHGSVTLAIGDGANDIAMIQEAHVGIGITGKEGLQAARTSDYSIAQFRFLLKLLLVHGRWNYVRICKYTLGTFWKEMLFYTTQGCFQMYNGYTGTSLYEPWSLSMFNTLFTSLPVIFMGVFEKDLAASTLLAAPELYSMGQRNGGFSIKIYLWWACMAACEAVLIFNVAHGIYGEALFTTDNGLYATGALTFTCCITVISLKLQVLELHNKSITAVIAIFLSVGGWYLWNILLAILYHNNVIYAVKDAFLQRFGRNLLWWLTLIVTVVLFVVFEMAIGTIRSSLFPTDVDVFQGYEQDLGVRRRFEEAAADYLQHGCDKGTQKSSLRFAMESAEEAEREQHIEDLLKRPRTMTNEQRKEGHVRKRNSWAVAEDGEVVEVSRNQDTEAAPKRTLDAAELFSKGFGSVKKGPDLR